MVPELNLNTFDSRKEASNAAADLIAASLRKALDADDEASLLVSGGSSPLDCLSALSEKQLDWNRVRVSLTDERCVPVMDDASNEKMVRGQLLQNEAEEARFIGLDDKAVPGLARCLCCALVGMGEDGHFASLFPDNPRLSALLEVDGEPACEQITTLASDVKRVTANLPLLLSGDVVVLLVFGKNKLAIVESPGELPIAALLSQQKTPVQIFWAA